MLLSAAVEFLWMPSTLWPWRVFLQNKKKVERSAIRWIWWLIQHIHLIFYEKVVNRKGRVHGCVVLAEQPGVVCPQLRLNTTNSFAVGGCSNTAPHSLWSSEGRNSLWIRLLLSKNATSFVFTCDFDIRAFFGFTSPSPTHCILWRLISGSYSKSNNSSQVITR